MKKLAGLLLLLVLCCAPPPGAPDSPGGQRARPVPAGDALISFASLNSARIRRAAMRFPKRPRLRSAAPVELTASDGSGLTLVSYRARAIVDGPLAFTELQLQFRNPRPDVLEGRFSVTLPPSAAVSRFAMRIDNRWQEAEMVEKQRARQTYEQVLHQGLDPALLEHKAGNAFNARIFPIPANGDKFIILSYSQTLEHNGSAYVLPLRGLPSIEQLDVEVSVRSGDHFATRRVSEQHVVPQQDLTVLATASRQALQHGDLIAVRVRPPLSESPQKLKRIALLFDTSASRALGFRSEVSRLGELIGQLTKLHGNELAIHLATFDQRVAPVFAGRAADFGKAQLDEVLSRRPLGASNLEAALGWLAGVGPLDRAVLLTDGVATLGPREAAGLRHALEAQRGKLARLDVVIGGGIRDEPSMRALVVGPLTEHGAVLDGQLAAATLARRISLLTQSGIGVEVPGAHWPWPASLDGMQPGDDALIFVRIEPDKLNGEVEVKLTGPLAASERYTVRPAEGSLLERAAASAHIASLAAERANLPQAPSGPHISERKRLRQRIIELSQQYRVISDHTALLVLESEADYQRFGIKRETLGDILVLGADGLKRMQRDAASIPALPTRAPAAGRLSRAMRSSLPPDPDAPIAPPPANAPVGEPSADAAYAASLADLRRFESQQQPKSEPAVMPNPIIRTQPGRQRRSAAAAPAPRPPPGPSPRPHRMRPSSASQADVHGYGYDFSDDPLASSGFGPNDATARVARSGGAATRDPAAGSGETQLRAHRLAAFAAQARESQAYSGRMAEVMQMLDPTQCPRANCVERAVVKALAWRNRAPADVMALVALGEALEARGHLRLAERAYGSIIDLYPGRAEMQRFAAGRLRRLGAVAATIARDAYAVALEDRPDHLTAYRAQAFGLLRAGNAKAAFAALANGFRAYPDGRFVGGIEVLRADLGLLGAAWLRSEPGAHAVIEERLQRRGAVLATTPSLRFVLSWETDANDVDLHVADGDGHHVFYERMTMPSGGRLLQDVTNGFGPEMFVIDAAPQAYPYHIMVHYYRRGPMGFGMGMVEIIAHDGKGRLSFDDRPFVVMNGNTFVDLGNVPAPLSQAASP